MRERVFASAVCHVMGGALLGYIVFIDDGLHFDWPVWPWYAGLVTILTCICSRSLVRVGAPIGLRAVLSFSGALAMVLTAAAFDLRTLPSKEPLVASVATVVVLPLICNLYFLPSWIAALLPVMFNSKIPRESQG